jgi:hypothetical protein
MSREASTTFLLVLVFVRQVGKKNANTLILCHWEAASYG